MTVCAEQAQNRFRQQKIPAPPQAPGKAEDATTVETKWLDDFLALALYKSFSRAAEARNITQSALSRRVRMLEAWFGAELIDRSSYPIGLTEAGEKFLPRAEEVRQMIDNLRYDVRAPYFPAHEVLSVCMLSTLALTLFPRLIARLDAAKERFRFRFVDAKTTVHDNLETLRHGAVDFLLIYAHDNVRALQSFRGFPYLVLGTERGLPVSVPDADGRPRHSLYQSQVAVDYLSYRNHSFFANALPEVVRRGNFRLNTIYENALAAALLAMVRKGMGVAWIPESLIEEDLASGSLVRAGAEEHDLIVEIRMYRQADGHSPLKERFWRKVAEIAPLCRAGEAPGDERA